MTKPLKENVGQHRPEEDGTLVSSSARTFSRLIKKEKVRECMRHLRSLVNPGEGVGKVSTLATLENALKALKDANAPQDNRGGKKQSQSSGGGTQPSNALNTTSNTQSKSSSEGEEILSYSSLPFTEAKTYSVQLSLVEGEVVAAERALLLALNYPNDSWRGCLLTNFIFDPDIPRILTSLYNFGQNRKLLRESCGTANKKQEQFCLRFRVNPSLSRGTFAAPSSDRYLPFLVKADYQFVRPICTTTPSTGGALADQTSGRTRITCDSSGLGSETSFTTARQTTVGTVDEATPVCGPNDQLSLSIARIDHFYAEPNFVPKRNRFATRLTAKCHLTNVEPAITSLIGFLPQDLEHVSIFDLVHTSDLVKIFDAYKEVAERQLDGSGDRWTHVPPVRWRCCNGTHLVIQTNIRSHMEKSSGTVDFIYGLHEIMRGPEKLARFFDPTASNHFSRLRLSQQKQASGNLNNNSNKNSSMTADQAQMQGLPDDVTTVTEGVNHGGGISGLSGSGNVPAASMTWMVDPRRLRLKALFQDLSPTELAHATSLGISFSDPSMGSDVVSEKKLASRESVDLDNDSSNVPQSRTTAKSGSQRRRHHRSDEASASATPEQCLTVTAAARGFSYDAWNHFQHIQRYLLSVQRESATADPRSRLHGQARNKGISSSAAMNSDVLIPGSVGCHSSMPPGLPVIGQSLCSSALVQISDNDAQVVGTDGDVQGAPRSVLPTPTCYWREGSDERANIKTTPDIGKVSKEAVTDKYESSHHQTWHPSSALPLTVDNLHRHTRIQEKHYRLQMIHQLQLQGQQQPRGQRVRVYRVASKPKGFGSQQPKQKQEQQQDPQQQVSTVAAASNVAPIPPSREQQSQSQQQVPGNHGYRYRNRQTAPGHDVPRSEAESNSQTVGVKQDVRNNKRKLPISNKRSSTTGSSGVSDSSSRDSASGYPIRSDVPDVCTAEGGRSSPICQSDDNRWRRKYRKKGGVDFTPSQTQPAPREPQAPQLGMPPMHFAACYPASREPIRSSRRLTGRRGHRRGHAYSGDHLDLYANATHPVPFYVPGTAAPPPPPPPPPPMTSPSGGREGTSRRAHRSMAGVVPGAVPATPFAGLWGLPSWGFVPLMPWHSYPGAPVQWPYYPQVGGALHPYLHGGFFGNHQQQQRQQQQPQQQQQSQQQQQPSQQPQQSQPNQDQQATPQQRQQQQKQPPLSQTVRRSNADAEPSRCDVRTSTRLDMRSDSRTSREHCLDWDVDIEKKCAVSPLHLASPQPSVVVTAHTEDQGSEMLSSPADGGSEGASSSFVYLLDSSNNGSFSTGQRLKRQYTAEEQQLQGCAEPDRGSKKLKIVPAALSQERQSEMHRTAVGETEGSRGRRSRFDVVPTRGQPFWLTESGTDFSEQTMMRYQIPCPLESGSSSTVPSNSGNDNGTSVSNRSDSRRQSSALWRCRFGKLEQSEEWVDFARKAKQWRVEQLLTVGTQVIELLQYGCSDEEGNGESNALPQSNRSQYSTTMSSEVDHSRSQRQQENQQLQVIQTHRPSERLRLKTSRSYGAASRERSRLSGRVKSVSSGLESPSAGRGDSCSRWSSSIKESDGVTGSDEGSCLSGITEFHSEMEPFLDCLFIGSNVRQTIGTAAADADVVTEVSAVVPDLESARSSMGNVRRPEKEEEIAGDETAKSEEQEVSVAVMTDSMGISIASVEDEDLVIANADVDTAGLSSGIVEPRHEALKSSEPDVSETAGILPAEVEMSGASPADSLDSVD